MLHVESLRAGHGAGTVLHDVGLAVASGEVHAVVGHNGAGKSTLIHTIAGLIRPTSGRIRLDRADVTGLPSHRRARAGLALVPQGRRVFASLTVAEHLSLAPGRLDRGVWTRQRVLELLPQLGNRLRHRGSQLSGGEQQMLAIARALLTQPRLLLLDEPTEGLAPTLARQIGGLVGQLAGTGLAILLTAPQPDLPAAVADRITILTAGRATPATTDLRQLRAALTPGNAATAGTATAATGVAAAPAGVAAAAAGVAGETASVVHARPDPHRATVPAWVGLVSPPDPVGTINTGGSHDHHH